MELSAQAVSAQTCWAELTPHSLHSSLLHSLLSIPPFSLHDPAGQPRLQSVVQHGQMCQMYSHGFGFEKSSLTIHIFIFTSCSAHMHTSHLLAAVGTFIRIIATSLHLISIHAEHLIHLTWGKSAGMSCKTFTLCFTSELLLTSPPQQNTHFQEHLNLQVWFSALRV